jgi:hypothetical protein
MNNQTTTPFDAEGSNYRIDIASTNPLIGTLAPTEVADTLNNVRAVLSVLIESSPSKDFAPSDACNDGMYMIHSWLRSTLRYVAQVKPETTP